MDMLVSRSIIKCLKKYNHLIFQKFLPKIIKGDKRVFIINGKIKGSITRIPKKGSFLSNMSKGATATTSKLSSHELKVCKNVANLLKKKIFILLV